MVQNGMNRIGIISNNENEEIEETPRDKLIFTRINGLISTLINRVKLKTLQFTNDPHMLTQQLEIIIKSNMEIIDHKDANINGYIRELTRTCQTIDKAMNLWRPTNSDEYCGLPLTYEIFKIYKEIMTLYSYYNDNDETPIKHFTSCINNTITNQLKVLK